MSLSLSTLIPFHITRSCLATVVSVGGWNVLTALARHGFHVAWRDRPFPPLMAGIMGRSALVQGIYQELDTTCGKEEAFRPCRRF
jgi:hypothetical protein